MMDFASEGQVIGFCLSLDCRGVRREVRFRVGLDCSLGPYLEEALIRAGMPKAIISAFIERERGRLTFKNVPLTPGCP
jgi:hypothetical protein